MPHPLDPAYGVKVRPHVRVRNAAARGFAPGGNYGYNTGGTMHVVQPHSRSHPNAAARGQAPGGNYGYNTGGPMNVQPNMPPGYDTPQMQGAQAPPPVVMQGGQQTLGGYQQPAQAAAIAGMDPAAQAAVRARANAYARARMKQMQRVASVLPPELQKQLASSQRQIDPAAAWRAISGAFAAQSKQAGYQDPRYYLRYVLPALLQNQ